MEPSLHNSNPKGDATAIDSCSGELKNQVFVCLAVIANTLGNFLLSVGMHAIQLKPSASPLEYLRIFANLWIDAGVILLIVWFASQLSLLSWADLSYVLPITAASYVLTAVLGKIFLHEFISLAVAHPVGSFCIAANCPVFTSCARRTRGMLSRRR